MYIILNDTSNEAKGPQGVTGIQGITGSAGGLWLEGNVYYGLVENLSTISVSGYSLPISPVPYNLFLDKESGTFFDLSSFPTSITSLPIYNSNGTPSSQYTYMIDCVTNHMFRRELNVAGVIDLYDIMPVGSYILRVQWSDTSKNGEIYQLQADGTWVLQDCILPISIA